ncbi:15542_t:CDS:2, partial [Funneliformis geosporum]
KKLNFNQKRLLNRTLFAESVWKVDRLCNAICAKGCTGIAENENICNECSFIRYNRALCHRVDRPLLLSSNIKFNPKHYWEDNPLKKYLQNCDLQNAENPWIALADKAIKDAFKDMPVFTGLCEVMGNAIERKIKNKSKKNLKYSDEFTDFLTILGGISSRALELFRQNLEVSTKSNTSAIQPNKASHFVTYFTNNENPEQRFITQRENDRRKIAK